MKKLIFFAACCAAMCAAGCSDEDGQSTVASPAIVYNDDADLWTNKASLTVRTEDGTAPVVEYRRKGSEPWTEAPATRMPDGSFKVLLLPRWVEAQAHPSGAPQFTLDPAVGVFAGNTYQYRMVRNGAPVAGSEGQFETAAGQSIPGGDMNRWAKYNGYSEEQTAAAVFYPNAGQADAFWSNGNNAITQTLCLPDTLAANSYAAKLKGFAISFLNMFAAGNLYSGNFEMSGLAGYACFGQKYEFTARPTALRVRYKATITPLEVLGLKKDSGLTLEDLDRARILVCITDWTAQHRVHSGYGVELEAVNAFDPEIDARTDEGRIIAYGSHWIGASVGEWTELTIPIIYKDKTARPATGSYSLVISASASGYGDFLCGSGGNELLLDDIEWVY